MCPRVPARATADVPVSYLRLVVFLENSERDWSAAVTENVSTLSGFVAYCAVEPRMENEAC